MDTYLRGRKVNATQVCGRPSIETLELIRKLRWIGMEEEAEQVQINLPDSAGAVISAVHETD